jgi:hypothetical protein
LLLKKNIAMLAATIVCTTFEVIVSLHVGATVVTLPINQLRFFV